MNRLLKFGSLLLFVSLLVLALSVPGQAMPVGSGAPAAQTVADDGLQIVPDEIEPSVREGNMRVSTETGAPLFIYGEKYAVQSGTAEAMAEEYLQAQVGLLQLNKADLSDLEHRFTRQGPSGYTVRYDQFVDQVPVYNGEIAVHINNQNIVSFVANNYKTAVSIDDPIPTLRPAEAQAIAFEYLDVQGNLRFDETTLYVYYNKGETSLVYQVRVVPQSPVGDWEVLVDAHTGDLIKVLNTTYHTVHEDEVVSLQLLDENAKVATASAASAEASLVDGDGNVFDPDPLTSGTATYGDTGFSDNGDADSTELNAELMNVTLLDIQLDSGMHTLIGPYAEIVDSESPFNGLFSQASSTFNYNRSDDAFEAVNTYYHIDASMRYLNETLGLNIMPIQYSGGARFDPHGLGGADNSHYSSATGEVAFGEGGVDDAEDSDVVHHELGHGLHDWVTGGSLSQVNGLSEGSGDYWAQSYNRSIDSWTDTDPAYHYVFRWDGHNEFWNGRVTNYPGIYPDDLVGQIHTDGQIWATCNMSVWDAIGKEQLDTAFWDGLGMTNSTTNQEDAANAVLQSAIDMGYDLTTLNTMRSIYESCGYVMMGIPFADFSLDPSPDVADVCSPADAVFDVAVTAMNGFTGAVDMSTVGEPGTAVFDPNPITPTESTELTVSGAAVGNYTFDIVGQSVLTPSLIHTSTVGLNVFDSAPSAPTLTAPADTATNVSSLPTFSWSSTTATESLLEVATDMGFTNIVYSATVTTNTHTATSALANSTTYYWRVGGSNACGDSSSSSTFSFTTQTGSLVCNGGTVVFESGIPSDFITEDNGGNVYWTTTDDSVGCAAPNWSGNNETGGSGEAACADADGTNNPPSAYDAEMWTNGFDLSTSSAATLEFQAAYNDIGTADLFTVDISTNGGSSWVNEISWNEDHDESISLDLTDYLGEADVIVRYRYSGTGWDWWAQVDEITLNCTEGPAPTYGIELSDDASLSGEPGEVVTHTVTVTNTGNAMDTYTIGVSDNWGATAPADVTVDAGLSSTFDMVVTVPMSATNGAADVATVTLTSVNDNSATGSVDLTTTAVADTFIYLPVVLKP